MVQFMRYMTVCCLNGDRNWREPSYMKKQVEVVAGDSFQSIYEEEIAKWQADEKKKKKD